MGLHDIGLAVVAFLSEVLGTLSGFGSSTFFVPTAVRIESFQLVLALTAILHCFGNTSKIFLFREHFEKKYLFQLAVPSLVATGLGALLTPYVSTTILSRALGIVLALLALLFWSGKFRAKRESAWTGIILCTLSGFAAGLVGTGGAIRGLALASLGIEKNAFVVLSSAIDFGADFLRLIIYLNNGFMDWNQWFYIPLLAAAAFAGARAGKVLLSYVNQRQFEKTVAIFIFASGILMMVQF